DESSDRSIDGLVETMFQESYTVTLANRGRSRFNNLVNSPDEQKSSIDAPAFEMHSANGKTAHSEELALMPWIVGTVATITIPLGLWGIWKLYKGKKNKKNSDNDMSRFHARDWEIFNNELHYHISNLF